MDEKDLHQRLADAEDLMDRLPEALRLRFETLLYGYSPDELLEIYKKIGAPKVDKGFIRLLGDSYNEAEHLHDFRVKELFSMVCQDKHIVERTTG